MKSALNISLRTKVFYQGVLYLTHFSFITRLFSVLRFLARTWPTLAIVTVIELSDRTLPQVTYTRSYNMIHKWR